VSQLKYAAGGDHIFHPPRQFLKSFVHLPHFQYQPKRQNILCLPVLLKSRQYAALQAVFLSNVHGGQFYVKFAYCIGIITPLLNILLPNKRV
jgi:hypothetical protein